MTSGQVLSKPDSCKAWLAKWTVATLDPGACCGLLGWAVVCCAVLWCAVLRRIFPRAQRAQVFSMGQLRVLSTRDGTAPGTINQQQQQPLGHSPTGTLTPPSPFCTHQQQMKHSASASLLSPKLAAEQAAADAAAAAEAAKQAAQVVPLQDHPNVTTAGSPAAGPLGVLQLTLQVRKN